MDESKCKELKAELAGQPEPQVVAAARFFEGNDDPGSIGCNLMDHPGVEVFREIFVGLLSRPDVQAVYVQITELDPGDGCWPFSDTIFVVGAIPGDELCELVGELQPDEVGSGQFHTLPEVVRRHGAPVQAVWWD